MEADHGGEEGGEDVVGAVEEGAGVDGLAEHDVGEDEVRVDALDGGEDAVEDGLESW